jgi:hypothetical protein
MQRRTVAARLFLATSSCALATAAVASETVTYSYDALGRLVATSSSGTVNNGLATTIAYDPAGNRSCYTVAGAATGTGGSCTPPPPPSPPPPPPPSSGPVANPDSASASACSSITVNVTANDTDPGGHYPVTLVSATSTNGRGPASVFSASTIEFDSNGRAGTASIDYVIQNSIGQTATGTLSVTIPSAGTCS